MTPVAAAPLPVQPASLEHRLVTGHLDVAYRLADRYFLPGGDRDDLRQEAALALIEAARVYDPATGPFVALAVTVVRRRLFDRMKAEQRGGKRALNESAGGDVLHLAAASHDVHAVVEQRLELQRIRRAAASLTVLERDSMGACLRGEPYYLTAQGDNAVQRARRKLREAA